MHEEVWEQALNRSLESVSALADQFLGEFGDNGSYGSAQVEDEEILLTARQVFTTLIEILLGRSSEASLKQHADYLGRRRAQQGIPIASLVDAILLDFSILWRNIRAVTDDDSGNVLIEHVEQLHEVVTRYNFYVRDAYRREQARKLQDATLANAHYLDRLFSSETIGNLGFNEVSRVLGVPNNAEYEVIVFHPSTSVEARKNLVPVTTTGKLFGHGFRGMYCIFWDVASPVLEIPEVVSQLSGIRFDHVIGLSGVRRAVRSSRLIFDSAKQPPTLKSADDLIWAVAGDTLATLDSGQIDGITAVLVQLEERGDPTINILNEYLHTGSIKETASASYCHRNTVINRLNQFAKMTGADVTRPIDAAKVLLAMYRKSYHSKTVDL